jgi:ABC-type lipoprotein release transport system permease subunit
VNPADPLVYAFVSAALALVGLLASLMPARKALRTDPIAVLREP